MPHQIVNPRIKKLPVYKTKRLFDIIFAFVFLLIASPIFIFILALIFVEHICRGDLFAPLFYREIRISRGDNFYLIKFNIFNPKVIETMRENHQFIATKDIEKDQRNLIKVGYFLKQIYLDELPQLINILIGDLSVVGPRPVNIKVYQKTLARGIANKTIIKAGLTGAYQSFKGLTKKTDVELDGEYIDFYRQNSPGKVLLLDLKIIIRTIRILFRAQGL